MKIKHRIPLGALVEVAELGGVRLYVVQHTFAFPDKPKLPTYSLFFDKEVIKDLKELDDAYGLGMVKSEAAKKYVDTLYKTFTDRFLSHITEDKIMTVSFK